jgi:quercetin dioxygenase-like cupin family protein
MQNNKQEHAEQIVTDLKMEINPDSPDSMLIDFARYRVFSDHLATVAIVHDAGEKSIVAVVWNLASGQENERHYHPAMDHIHVILSGRAEYHLGDAAPITVGIGQAVMIPAGVVHGVKNVGTESCSYLAITSPGKYEKVLVDEAPDGD